MRHNMYLNATTTSFTVIAVLVPVIAVSSKVLSGALTLGTLMQDIGAFYAMTAAVAWSTLEAFHDNMLNIVAPSRSPREAG